MKKKKQTPRIKSKDNMNTEIKINRITDSSLKQKISDYILRDLPEWFGIESSREKYVAETENQEFLPLNTKAFS